MLAITLRIYISWYLLSFAREGLDGNGLQLENFGHLFQVLPAWQCPFKFESFSDVRMKWASFARLQKILEFTELCLRYFKRYDSKTWLYYYYGVSLARLR